jgi:hypothetical protein
MIQFYFGIFEQKSKKTKKKASVEISTIDSVSKMQECPKMQEHPKIHEQGRCMSSQRWDLPRLGLLEKEREWQMR